MAGNDFLGASLFGEQAIMDSDRAPRLWYYVGSILFAAPLALVAAALWRTPTLDAPLINGLIAILAVAFAAEVSAFKSASGATFSLAFIPFLAAAFLFPVFWVMVLAGTTEFAVDAFVRRKPWYKTLFNASKEILAVGVAAAVYQVLGGKASLEFSGFAPAAVLGAGISYFAVNSAAVAHAVSLDQGIGFGNAWARANAGSVVYDLFAIPIAALLAYLYVQYELGGVAALVLPLFIVRHVYAMNMQLIQTNRDLLDLMVKAIEARDPYTSGHSQRVAQYARIVAKESGLHGKQVDQIYTAALLHDVGKIYEDYAPLLRKDGRLTQEEKALLQTHPIRSAELVATISALKGPVEESVRHHHENFNGTGYPDGLGGDSIPVGARIIMVADTLDAMTTDRPYRKALSFERALEEFRKYSGLQFDPKLVALVEKSMLLRRHFGQRLDLPSPLGQPIGKPPVSRVARATA